MPKATLTYDLPEDRDEFEVAVNAAKYYVVLHNIDQILRNKIKYAGDEVSDDYIKVLEMIRSELWEQLEMNNISLD